MTVSFSPASIAAPGSGSSTMNITVASTAAAGTSTITVTGTGGTITHTTTVTLTVTSGTITQLLGNPGFENGSANPAPWTVTAGVIDSSTGEPAHSGSWKAWLNGYGTTHTDSILQTVTIPSTATTATLAFWLHIDTAETTTTTAFDTLKVQIRNTSGTVLSTLATYSNLNKATGFSQKSFDVTAFKGQTIQVFLVGIGGQLAADLLRRRRLHPERAVTQGPKSAAHRRPSPRGGGRFSFRGPFSGSLRPPARTHSFVGACSCLLAKLLLFNLRTF